MENTKKFNIDHLSFKAIKTSISSIPKIIFKRKHYSFYNSPSEKNTRDNDSLCEDNNHLNNELVTYDNNNQNNKAKPHTKFPSSDIEHNNIKKILDKDAINTNKESNDNISQQISSLQKELNDKTLYIRQMNKNFKDKILLIENENRKLINSIENTYKELIQKLTQSYETKILLIISQCDSKCIDYEKELLKAINEMRSIQSSSILISIHNELLTQLNEKWKEKLNTIRKENTDSFGKVISLLKSKEEYKLLLIRLENYQLNKVDISKIESLLQLNQTNQEYGKDYNYQTEKNNLVQLEREVLYHKSVFDIKVLTENTLKNIELNTNNKYDNLRRAIEDKFNTWIDRSNEENKNIKELNPEDFSFSTMSYESEFQIKLSKNNNTGRILNNNRYENKNIDEYYQQSFNNDTLKSNDKISLDFEVRFAQ